MKRYLGVWFVAVLALVLAACDSGVQTPVFDAQTGTEHCADHNGSPLKVEAEDSGKVIYVKDTRTGDYIYVTVEIDGIYATLTPVDPDVELVDASWCIKAGTQAGNGTGLDIKTPFTFTNPRGIVITQVVSYIMVYSVTTKEPESELVCNDETAWAAGHRYINPGNWATYTAYAGAAKTVTLFAGQTIDIGTVSFSAPDNAKVTITINITSPNGFQNVAENVKIQDYASAPSGNPAPGGFAHKGFATGQSFSIVVPENNFYGVHVDAVACVKK